ncbi:hypothetical protein [Bacteroides sp. CAG:633]|uniref:hypothetical protein n=1 Tax=Bacteroides sp. CAG:633 TaxID=1262744 RepID=UPI000A90BA13|nr:hypothetical protein [Bacteroides sp. CAG:633]
MPKRCSKNIFFFPFIDKKVVSLPKIKGNDFLAGFLFAEKNHSISSWPVKNQVFYIFGKPIIHLKNGKLWQAERI